MKKIHVLLMTLASCAIFYTSCDTKNNEDPPQIDEIEEIILSVSGNNGEVITVTGTDVVKEVIIKAADKTDRDVEITLTLDAADGSAVLSSSKVTINKGSSQASVAITFPAAKFPEGTAEKAIKVIASTTAEKVAFSPAFTTFNVKGDKGAEAPAVLTAMPVALNINTTDAAGVAVVDFSLSKAIDEDLEISHEYESAADFVGIDGVVWNPSPIVIQKGETILQLSITVPQGRNGSMPVKFGCSNAKVDFEPASFKFIFTKTVRPEVSISALSTTANVSGNDVSREIEVKMNMASENPVTVNLNVTSNNDLKGAITPASIVFAKGEVTKTATIVFAATDFVSGTAANVTVTATTSEATMKPSASSLVFKVTGPDPKEDLQISWAPKDNVTEFVFLPGETKDKDLSIYFETKDRVAATKKITLTPHISGFDKEDYAPFSETTVIQPGGYYVFYQMKVKQSSVGKTLRISFTSDDATFAPTQQAEYVFASKTLAPPAQKYNGNIGLSITGQKEIVHTMNGQEKDFYLTVSTADGSVPAGPSIINFVVTGFDTDDYYFWDNPLLFTTNTKSIWVKIKASAAGKTGTITPVSDYITVASDAAVTIKAE